MPKNLLITGGAGFVGSHVIEYYIKNTDYNITTLDRLDYSGNLNRISYIMDKYPDQKKRLRVVYHDLKAEINPVIAKKLGDINIIMHMAAGSHVDRSIENPMEFVMDNVVGTANILNYARTLENLEKFVYQSTDEVFGPAPEGVKYKERDRYNSTNPYSATKAGAEELCVAFENTYGIPMVVVHSMNILGGLQHPEKYVPLCIRKILNDETVYIHGSPDRTKAGSRFYIHAKDLADGINFILTHNPVCPPDSGNAKIQKFNIVGFEEIDNLTLAQIIAEELGRELKYEIIDFHSSRPGHDLRYALDGGLLKSQGWEPSENIRQRIKEIVEWYMDNPDWLKI